MGRLCAQNDRLCLLNNHQVRGQLAGALDGTHLVETGYAGYNPMMSMNSLGGSMMGMGTGYGAFGTGMESLYGGGVGQQAAFNTYNPYGNGMFNFANNGMFGQNAFGTGFNNNIFGAGTQNGLGMQQQQQQTQQQMGNFQTTAQNQMSAVNNGNTMRAYGRRTQNFNNNNNNNNYAPTRVGQASNGCNGFGCQQQQGWNAKTKV
ncbi:unnamed protein product [Caenorhabditis sp. 36 PRJEB53466]|nr:unnamed protein product [Caenorhabditis sp. 36 PRJEB53466]